MPNAVEGIKTIDLHLSDTDKMKIKEFILSRDLINQSNKLKGDTLIVILKE